MSRRLGQNSVAWRARPEYVARAVAAHGIILAFLTAPPAGAALVERQWQLAAALGGPAAVCAGIGVISARRALPADLRMIEAVCTLSALFALGAVLPIPGFVVLGLSGWDACFEAMSAMTSTGLTVASATMEWPVSGHLLRGWLQWVGGFAIAVAGVAVIVGPGETVKRLGRVGLDETDLLSSTRAQGRELLKVYALITVFGVALLLPLLPNWWEALSVGLAAVSTGGFSPRPDSLADYSHAAQFVTILLCLSTSASLMVYVLALRKGLGQAIGGTNARAMLIAICAGVMLVALINLLSGAMSLGDLHDALLNYVSALTTAGFSAAPVAESHALLAILLAAMIVGGGVGSTAGGIKIDRFIMVIRMTSLSLLRMRTPPHALTRLKENGTPVGDERITSLVAVVCCYTMTALLAWIVFLASGEAPLASLFDIISALSTVGLSTGVTGPDLAPHLKVVLAASMFLGRLEFLAVLVVLSPATWKTGSNS